MNTNSILINHSFLREGDSRHARDLPLFVFTDWKARLKRSLLWAFNHGLIPGFIVAWGVRIFRLKKS